MRLISAGSGVRFPAPPPNSYQARSFRGRPFYLAQRHGEHRGIYITPLSQFSRWLCAKSILLFIRSEAYSKRQMPGKTFIAKVAAAIRDERMMAPGAAVLVGVSGGPDSMALLLALFELAAARGGRLTVAHLN